MELDGALHGAANAVRRGALPGCGNRCAAAWPRLTLMQKGGTVFPAFWSARTAKRHMLAGVDLIKTFPDLLKKPAKRCCLRTTLNETAIAASSIHDALWLHDVGGSFCRAAMRGSCRGGLDLPDRQQAYLLKAFGQSFLFAHRKPT